MIAGDPVQPNLPGHVITVPPIAGIPPYCSCGWRAPHSVYRPGDEILADHLAAVRAEKDA